MRPTPSAIVRYAGLPAVLVTNPTNIRYLTGFLCSEGAVLITAEAYHLFIDGRYGEAAREKSDRLKCLRTHERHELATFLKRRRVIGIEGEYMTVDGEAQMKRKFKSIKFVHTSGVVEQFRRTKNADELRLLRRADTITREMLRRVPSALIPGLRETDLAWMLRTWAQELGADDLSFSPIVAFGTHTSRPHHVPSQRRLRARDSVLVDCGARFQGYCGDRTEMFFLGEPTARQRQALDAVREAKDAAKDMVNAGVNTGDFDACARNILQRYGMEDAFVHALGHGVGLEIHEGVSLSQNGKQQSLLLHEAITIEPGVYFPGQFGIRLEDMVIVSK